MGITKLARSEGHKALQLKLEGQEMYRVNAA